MTALTIQVPGPPQGKGRPRRGANGVMYTPAKTRAYEQRVGLLAKAAMRGRAPLEGALALSLQARFEVPASWPKRDRAAALAGQVRPTSRPDADNALKAVADALNGVVWRDDAQLVEVTVVKCYAEEPGLTIRVSPWPRTYEETP